MAANQSPAFVGSRAAAFCESQAHARTTAGANVTANIFNVGSYGCTFYRIGYGYGLDWSYFNDLPPTGCSGIGLTSIVNQPHTVDTCFQRLTWQSTYTTPPGGSGTFYTWVSEVARGSLTTSVTDSGTAYSWVGNSPTSVPGSPVEPDSSAVVETSSAITITCVWTGTYLDEEEVEHPWTETIVVTFNKPFTLADFCSEAAALFLSLDIPADNAGGQTSWTSADGVPAQDGYSADTYRVTEDTPFGQGAGVILGGSAAENAGIISIVGVQYRLVNIQAALYTRTGDWENARLSAASEKLPFAGSEYRWVIPTAADLATIASGVAWQAGISTVASYTSPTPDFPAPT